MRPNANASTGYQYPYPNEPSKWGFEERQFSQGLRHLFDMLFSRKLQNVLIADGAVNGRTIAKGSVALRHLVEDFGKDLDISENESITELAEDVSGAQSTADSAASAAEALPNTLFPVGCIVLMDSAPSFGTWEETDIGLEDVTAWKRTA